MVSVTQKQEIRDEQLLERHLSGEAEAFGSLVRRYQSELYGFLVRFTGDRTLAEDVFQETFLQVHQSAATFDTTRRFRPWLYTVASNKARDALRKKRRHPTAPLDAPLSSDGNGKSATYADLMPSEIPSPDEISVNRETRQAVKDMVHDLPESLRDVLMMSYFQALPQKDIAEALGIPVGTVKSRLHAAVRTFADKWTVWAQRQEKGEKSP